MTARPGRGQVGEQAFSNPSKRGSCRSKGTAHSNNNTVENEPRGSQTTTQYEREVPDCPHCVFLSPVVLMCHTSCVIRVSQWFLLVAFDRNRRRWVRHGFLQRSFHTAVHGGQLQLHRNTQRSLYTAVPQRSFYTAVHGGQLQLHRSSTAEFLHRSARRTVTVTPCVEWPEALGNS